MRPNDNIVAPKAAIATLIDAHGEVFGTIPLPEGVSRAGALLNLIPPGGTAELSKGCSLLRQPSAVGVVSHAERQESGANPDFQPTSATRLEKEMRVTLNRVKSQSKALDARMKALDTVEKIPRAPAQQAAPEPDGEAAAVVE